MELLHSIRKSHLEWIRSVQSDRNLASPAAPNSLFLTLFASITGLNFEKRPGSQGRDLITLLGETLRYGR